MNKIAENNIKEYISVGLISKQKVKLVFKRVDKRGIFFSFSDGSVIEANTDYLCNASRNTVLGIGKNAICFVEHLLALLNLFNIDGLEIAVDGMEIPLEDGSAKVWFDLFKDWKQDYLGAKQTLKEIKTSMHVQDDKGRAILVYPNSSFKMTYVFESPVDKSQTWTSWSINDDIEKLAFARTFASSVEHELLGLKGKMLSFDQNGFDMSLHSPDEPALHKLLDLFGDLSLSGENPLNLKAHFVSIKGSHALNTELAKLIREYFKQESINSK